MSSTTITTTPSRKRKTTAGDRAAKRRRATPTSSRKLFVPTVLKASIKGPVPATAMVRMPYYQNYSSDGTTLEHVWNLNSIFDPDHTGTGHQPYGHDTFETLYNRYVVTKVEYDIRPYSLSGTVGSCWLAGLVANNYQTKYTTAQWTEVPGVQMRPLRIDGQVGFRGTWYPHLITGVPLQTYMAEERYQAAFGVSPAEKICAHTMSTAMDAINVPGAGVITWAVKFWFTVKCYDPKDLGQS